MWYLYAPQKIIIKTERSHNGKDNDQGKEARANIDIKIMVNIK